MGRLDEPGPSVELEALHFRQYELFEEREVEARIKMVHLQVFWVFAAEQELLFVRAASID